MKKGHKKWQTSDKSYKIIKKVTRSHKLEYKSQRLLIKSQKVAN